MYLILNSVQLSFSFPSLLDPAWRKIDLWSCSACQLLHLGPKHPPDCAHNQLLLLACKLPINQLHVRAEEKSNPQGTVQEYRFR